MASQDVCLYNPGVDCKGGDCKTCGWNNSAKLTNISEAEKKNPYWERIYKLSDKQRAKGMETYGQGLESNPAAILKRIEHLQEELVDALMYCEWIKDKLMERTEQNE